MSDKRNYSATGSQGNIFFTNQDNEKACGTPITAAYFGKVAALSSTEVTKRGNEGSGEDH